ncbi:hypothetical protein [Robiginitalea sp. IMCC43444]|uniref:hypothetical protein n=1 Tax=Robiginitalea sp. IMCC43444 TaxID=3459121 RepID=UPI0040417C37
MPDQKELKCKYIFSDDYNPTYVNGAHGGITPKGEISINFFFERNALPNSQTYNVNEQGGLAGEVLEKAEPEDLNSSFVRFIKTGIIMNYNSAKAIHVFLGKHIDTLEAVQKTISEEK